MIFLSSQKTYFNEKLRKINNQVTSNKIKYVQTEKKLKII